MSWTELWPRVIRWVIWLLLMVVVMGWVARSRFRGRPAADARRLAHPPSTLLMLVVFALFAGIAVVSNVYANHTTSVFTTAVFVGFAALALWLVADYFVGRHEVSDEGMSHGSLTGRRQFRWTEVSGVRYSPAMKWFRLEIRSGRAARVSAMLVGLPEFARLALAKVPAGAIDPEAPPVVEARATAH